ncbi:hypothetical protein MACJ_003441 [Theileria orientalis]|uniref:Uncharacterized protein n=1 Tax=Theileria orientalis TaxID=68886 RepID=A0A976XID0_THEOR|nr:hypothetical protein MACJ_003441 [Theileria orientalis]
MVKSTSFLISQQCELINNENDPKRKKRVHNILTEQLNLLNNPSINTDNLISSTTSTTNTSIRPVKPIRAVSTPTKIGVNTQFNKSRSPPSIPSDSNALTKIKKVNKEIKKTNKLDKNFIELLTGENNTVQQEFNPTLKLREQVCQSHVMKSLGGYKFIEGNKFDNFVISILPKMENNNLISKY